MSLWYCEEHGMTNYQCCDKSSTATLPDHSDETKSYVMELHQAYEATRESRSGVFKTTIK